MKMPSIQDLLALLPLLSPLVGGIQQAVETVVSLVKANNEEADEAQLRKNLAGAVAILADIDARIAEHSK